MRDPDGDVAAASSAPDGVPEEGADSLRVEAGAAVGAVTAHLRKVAETASSEAELSIASLTAMAAAAVVCLLLAVAAWFCLVAAAVWFAVGQGLTLVTAFLLAGVLHLAVVVALFLWSRSLLRNIGFARTLGLVFPKSR